MTRSAPMVRFPDVNWCYCKAWWYRAHIKKVREGESSLLPDENAYSLFSTCNVLSRSSHLVPIMPSIQAATELHIAAKHPNKHGRKCHTIHHLLPMESTTLQRGQIVHVFVFFSGNNSSRLALGWCAGCDCHTAGGDDSHGGRPWVFLFELIGLWSCLGLKLIVIFISNYPFEPYPIF